MLKIGLIGAGYLGKIHLGLLSQMDNIQFIGFFDTNLENSITLNDQFNTKIYPTASELIQQSDALVIATPTTTHFEYAKTCIMAGKHVFVEKPVTSNVEEGTVLLAIMSQHSGILQIGMVERFNPAYTAASNQLSGLNKIFCNRLAPFTPRGADVSVVFDVMIHDIDIVLSLANAKVKSVKASGQKIISSTFDVATATVEFENGLISHFTASRMAERKYRIMELIGSNEFFRIDFLNKEASCYSRTNIGQGSIEAAYLTKDMDMLDEEKLMVMDVNAIGEELKSFVDCIVNNKKVVVSLDDGIRAMQLANEIEDQMNHRY